MAAEPSKTFSQPLRTFRNFQNLCRTDSKFPKLSKQVAEPCESFRSTWRTLKLRNPRTRVPAFQPAPTPPYRTCSWRIIPPRLKPLSTFQSTHLWNPWQLKPSPYTPGVEVEPKTTIAGEISHSHGFTRRHCWAIPPNRCSASRGKGGH